MTSPRQNLRTVSEEFIVSFSLLSAAQGAGGAPWRRAAMSAATLWGHVCVRLRPSSHQQPSVTSPSFVEIIYDGRETYFHMKRFTFALMTGYRWNFVEARPPLAAAAPGHLTPTLASCS